MTNHLQTLDTAASAVFEAWRGGTPAIAASTPVPAAMLSDDGLVRVIDAVGFLVRSANALQSSCAAELAKRSRKELGRDGLASGLGFVSPVALIASATGGSTGEAARLVAVGEATAERVGFTGERLPSKHPHAAEALAQGALSVQAAALITGMLDRIALRCEPARLDEAERVLVEQAAELSLDLLSRLVKKTEALLDPDGVEPKEDQLRADRSLSVVEDASGAIVLKGRFDPENGAPIKVAIEALVSAELRRARDAFGSAQARGECRCAFEAADASGSDAIQGARGNVNLLDGGRGDAKLPGGARDAANVPGGARDAANLPDGAEGGCPSCSCTDPVFAEERTMTQLRADALADLARHAIGCDETAIPSSSTVVLRADVQDVMAGTGSADLDGIDQPVSIETARRLMASAGLVPLVFNVASVVLDVGHTARLFTAAQRLALADRDGGCAFPGCPRPPGYAHAHHICWWHRDSGRTDLDNGVLLCSFHHHLVHRDEWLIQIRDHRVWFIPPPHVDAERRPRPGNNLRRTLATLRGSPNRPPGPADRMPGQSAGAAVA